MSETRALFERYHAGWVDRDPDRIALMHTEDTIFRLHDGSEPARGREGVRAAAASAFALLPDLGFEEVSLRVAEDWWVAEWRMTGTTPAGEPVSIDLVDVVTVENGQVKSKESYVDGRAMQAALATAAGT